MKRNMTHLSKHRMTVLYILGILYAGLFIKHHFTEENEPVDFSHQDHQLVSLVENSSPPTEIPVRYERKTSPETSPPKNPTNEESLSQKMTSIHSENFLSKDIFLDEEESENMMEEDISEFVEEPIEEEVFVNQEEEKKPSSEDSIEEYSIEEYAVQTNDTLWRIARNSYKGRDMAKAISLIQEENPGLNPRKLHVGKKLIIPTWKLQELLLSEKNSEISTPKQKINRVFKLPTLHRITAGETLYALAITYYHDERKWLNILHANPGVDPCKLKLGQKLTIPYCQEERNK